MANQPKSTTKIALFEHQEVRHIWDNKKKKWYFSVIDIVRILTGSSIPRRYWSDLKNKLKDEGSQVYEKIVQLKFLANDGKYYLSDACDVETLLRIVQSIPSPKAQPFKQWLARLGRERLDEIQNPELAMERMRELYEKKGYPKDWIDKRVRGIGVRHGLTDEWKNRGAEEGLEFAILTNEIMQGAFDMKSGEYGEFKGLRKQDNLRDHMNDIELILTMLAEATTTNLTQARDSQGFNPLRKDAKDGGDVAGRTRRDIETRSGKQVRSRENYLGLDERKQIKGKKKK